MSAGRAVCWEKWPLLKEKISKQKVRRKVRVGLSKRFALTALKTERLTLAQLPQMGYLPGRAMGLPFPLHDCLRTG